MANFKIYKLRFTSPLHLSNNRQDYAVSNRIIHSDTFYAAITSCLAMLQEEIPKTGDLGFSMSSLFPYYQQSEDAKPVYFFPQPLQANISAIKPEYNKKIKKIQYVDISYFEKIISSKTPSFGDEEIQNIYGEYLTEEKNFDNNFIYSNVNQRIRLKDRTMQGQAEPYYVDRIYFKGNSGFYFIVKGDTSLLDKSLPLLATEGIGTDRNIGNGMFEYARDEINISLPEKSDYCLCLSMFFPESKEQLTSLMEGKNIAYEISRRGGWISTYPYNSLRKNYIYGFLPGSVFKRETVSMEEIGKIVDLRPKWNDENLHSVFRSGRSLILPIVLPKNE